MSVAWYGRWWESRYECSMAWAVVGELILFAAHSDTLTVASTVGVYCLGRLALDQCTAIVFL